MYNLTTRGDKQFESNFLHNTHKGLCLNCEQEEAEIQYFILEVAQSSNLIPRLMETSLNTRRRRPWPQHQTYHIKSNFNVRSTLFPPVAFINIHNLTLLNMFCNTLILKKVPSPNVSVCSSQPFTDLRRLHQSPVSFHEALGYAFVFLRWNTFNSCRSAIATVCAATEESALFASLFSLLMLLHCV